MNFSNLGFIYIEVGQSVEVSFWWGEGEDHGAVFSMARFGGIESGLLPLSDPPPYHEYTVSNFRRNVHFDLDTITSQGQEFTDPAHVYVVTVTNTGADPGYFELDGMTSA
jgi:hypothetical protein